MASLIPRTTAVTSGRTVAFRQTPQLYGEIGTNLRRLPPKIVEAQTSILIDEYRRRSAIVMLLGRLLKGWRVAKVPKRLRGEYSVAIVNRERHAGLIDVGRKLRPAGSISPSGRKRKRVFTKPFYTGSRRAPQGITRPAAESKRMELRRIAVRFLRGAMLG